MHGDFRVALRPAMLLVLLGSTLLLAACGLTPTLVEPPAEAADGTFRWIDAGATPPPEYVPVMVTLPDAPPGPAICRAQIAVVYSNGYTTGELHTTHDHSSCRITYVGKISTFRDRGFQQLWTRHSAVYAWIPLEQFGEERPLALTKLWRANRVPSEISYSTTTTALGLWMTCAVMIADGLHAGKLVMHGNRIETQCLVPLADKEQAYSDGVYALYAPLDAPSTDR